jgi:hypothetical protein
MGVFKPEVHRLRLICYSGKPSSLKELGVEMEGCGQALQNRVFRLSCEAGLGNHTAEARRAQSEEFLIKKFSELCELRVSVVISSSQETRNNLKI